MANKLQPRREITKPCLASSRVLILMTICWALAFATAPQVSAFPMNGGYYTQPVRLGVNSEWYPQLAAGANIGWVRVTFVWRDINPANGVFDWSATDARINGAEAQGLKVLAVLSTAPAWAGSNANGTTPPSNINYWTQFVQAVAQRYAGRVAAYEIWNEPNFWNVGIGIGWNKSHGTSPRYVDYLRAAAVEIRNHAPGTLVVGPVTSSLPDSRTVQVFQQIEQASFIDGPGSSFLDVVSFHANGPEGVNTVFSKIKSHLSILSDHNPSNRNKPIWITEFGWESPPISETTQRDRIRDVVAGLRGVIIPACSICAPTYQQIFTQYRFTHAFIYKVIDTGDSATGAKAGIYRQNSGPKAVVPGYLRTLPFPARHLNDEHIPFSVSCAGLSCTFTSSATGNYYPYWDFGDGATGEGYVVSHTYAAPGQYFVSQGVMFYGAYVGPGGSDLQLIRVP